MCPSAAVASPPQGATCDSFPCSGSHSLHQEFRAEQLPPTHPAPRPHVSGHFLPGELPRAARAHSPLSRESESSCAHTASAGPRRFPGAPQPAERSHRGPRTSPAVALGTSAGVSLCPNPQRLGLPIQKPLLATPGSGGGSPLGSPTPPVLHPSHKSADLSVQLREPATNALASSRRSVVKRVNR